MAARGNDGAQGTARAVGEVVAAGDLFAKGLGIALAEIAPGYARTVMTVTEGMVNAAGVGHGGATFTLADTAFAYACNSHNTVTLATTCTIAFVDATRVGDVLTAEAREIFLERRNGIYDITVSNQEGKVVAEFRGHSRTVRGHFVDQSAGSEEP